MSEVTEILDLLASGDGSASDRLLPLVYEELRRLAAAKLATESPGQTLQATALVHEAYLRLVGSDKFVHWNSRAHFFGAAARSMRQILVDRARRKSSRKAGGERQRIELSSVEPAIGGSSIDLVVLDEALDKFQQVDPRACQVVHLRFFTGLTIAQTAMALEVSESTIEKDWFYAKAWLKQWWKFDH